VSSTRIFVYLSKLLPKRLPEPISSCFTLIHFTLHTFFGPGNFGRFHTFFAARALVKVTNRLSRLWRHAPKMDMPTKKQFQTIPVVAAPVPVRPSTSHAADDIPALNLQLLQSGTRDLYQRYLACRSQRKRTEILAEMRETIKPSYGNPLYVARSDESSPRFTVPSVVLSRDRVSAGVSRVPGVGTYLSPSMGLRMDITGRKFGRLTALSVHNCRAKVSSDGFRLTIPFWLCRLFAETNESLHCPDCSMGGGKRKLPTQSCDCLNL
jgi:hypothetical protein